MSLLWRRHRAETRAVSWGDVIPSRADRPTGITVTADDLHTVPAVAKCLALTAGLISQMPLHEQVYRGGRWVDTDPGQLLAQPSGVISRPDWVHQVVECMIMHGDAFGLIVSRDRSGWPTQIELVHPASVAWRSDHWIVDGRRVLVDDVWHVIGRPIPGSMWGRGLVDTLRPVIAHELAARRWSAEWFRDAGSPVAIFRVQGDPGPEQAAAFKARADAAIRGRSSLVVPSTVEVESWPGAGPGSVAIAEILRQSASDIAHHFGVPPELAGGVSGDAMTYSNIEARMLDLLSVGVGFWLAKLEAGLTAVLPRGRRCKLNESAIVRTDLRTKTETLVASTGGPIRTVNEARDLLDLPAVPGGDQVRALNMLSHNDLEAPVGKSV